MSRWIPLGLALAALLVMSGSAPGAGGKGKAPLDMYEATVDAAQAAKLARSGYDMAAAPQVAGGMRIDLVLTARDRDRLASEGIRLELIRNGKGQTVRQQAALQAAAGFTVWRSYDQPGGIRDELYSIAQKNPNIVKLEVIGHTLQGREIIALKVTKNARTVADGARPDVLYMGTIHAREWIATEVVRREMHYFVDNYNKNADVTNLVNTRELWFMPVANPDGYQYTFDGDRLWRKNLHDNDGDGQITKRRCRPEPQLRHRLGLRRRGLVVADLERDLPRYRSRLGARDTGAPGADRSNEVQVPGHLPLVRAAAPLSVRVAGPDADGGRPAVRRVLGDRLRPRRSAASTQASAPTCTSRTAPPTTTRTRRPARSRGRPSSNEGCNGCGFVFPDDESHVQAEYEQNLPFALDLAKSAADPGKPVSHLGNTVKPFYLDRATSIRPGEDEQPLGRLHVLGLVRRPAARAGARQARATAPPTRATTRSTAARP